MRQVTRNVDLEAVQDLLERPPRACLCYAGQQGPQAQPIVFRWHNGRYLAGIDAAARVEVDSEPRSGVEVVLLIDGGTQWFDLRAVYVRGLVTATDAPDGAPAGHRWFEVAPETTVAWDYGRLRDVGGETGR